MLDVFSRWLAGWHDGFPSAHRTDHQQRHGEPPPRQPSVQTHRSHDFRDRTRAMPETLQYIEGWYDRHRLHSRIGLL